MFILAKNTKWPNEYIRFLNDQKQITYHFYNEWPKTLNDPMTTLIPFKLCFLSYPKEWLKTPNDSIITYSFFLKQMTKKYKGPNDSKSFLNNWKNNQIIFARNDSKYWMTKWPPIFLSIVTSTQMHRKWPND